MSATARPRCWRVLAATALVALVLGLHLPAAREPNFTPDAVEYTAIARRWAQGRGLTTALKWHFLDLGPVTRPAAVERPVLYPLFGGAILRLFPHAEPLRTLQIANVVLAAGTAALACAAFHTVVTPPAAWIATGLLSLLPSFAKTVNVALSDVLFLALWLLALLLLPSVASRRHAAAFGVVTALATLTRPHGILLFGALFCMLHPRRLTGRSPAPAGWAAVAAATILIPYALYTYQAAQPGMRPALAVNFSVRHIHEASWDGFGRQIPSPLCFVCRHPGTVAVGIARKARANLAALWTNLFPLALFLFSSPKSPAADNQTLALRRAWLVLATCAFALSSISWVAAGSHRYMLPVAVLLLPMLVERCLWGARQSPSKRGLFLFALLATVSWHARYWHDNLRACNARWQRGHDAAVRAGLGWVRTLAGSHDVVASNNPWLVHYETERPAIACPNFHSHATFGRFSRHFHVRWVLLFVSPHEARLQHCLRQPEAVLVARYVDTGGQGAYLFLVQTFPQRVGYHPTQPAPLPDPGK